MFLNRKAHSDCWKALSTKRQKPNERRQTARIVRRIILPVSLSIFTQRTGSKNGVRSCLLPIITIGVKERGQVLPFAYHHHNLSPMARPLRIEFTSALYHVTSRGDGREDIYLDDADRRQCLSILGAVTKRFNWVVHAYCLMSNHYHLLVETPDSNLAQGMRHFNGVYTQRFNQRHQRVGHVFQGRYKAILVHKDSYLSPPDVN